MITFLEGILIEAYPTHVVLNVHGVGYHTLIPLSSYDKLPALGTKFQLLTHLRISEDAHTLFGFATASERDLFRLLVNHIPGIGPKTALDVLSGISVASFKAAVVAGDVKSLSQVKGIGKKTAERIVVELKDKVGVAAAWEAASENNAPSERDREINDAVLALIALGYKQVDAHKVIKTVLDERSGLQTSTDDLVRESLKRLA